MINITYTDAFLVVHPPYHFHTHLRNLWEVRLFNADVAEDLYYSFPHTDTSVLLNNTRHAVHAAHII